MKKLTTLIISLTALAGFLLINGCGSGVSNGAGSTDSTAKAMVQVERLARPAVNEGLVLTNASLNAFNSIPPSLDLRSDIAAVNTVLTEATAVLNVVKNLGTTNGLTPPGTSAVAGQFLPDVMRISVNNADFGTLHPLVANVDRTSNSRQTEVAYTSCVSVVAGAPLLCGGRKIRDDVIDITLSYIAGGAAQAAPVSAPYTSVPSYIISDAISYAPSHTAPLLSVFPFLAQPL